ncbi:hypothetical protein GJ496_000698 [Pomphorhynchus laevis]|nr:hypothetical protein GJ496_000698 [Pomphorhynchus laevis]
MELLDWMYRYALKHNKHKIRKDFYVDRLHNNVTVTILIMSCLAISTVQYANDPITCWVPAQFTRNYEIYTNRLCWVESTYYVPDYKQIPKDPNERKNRILGYYQWINFILIIQAMQFYLPKLFWYGRLAQSRLPIIYCLKLSIKYDSITNINERDSLESMIAHELVKNVQCRTYFKHRLYSGNLLFTVINFVAGWSNSYRIHLWYCLVRIFELSIVFIQFPILAKILGFDFIKYGLLIIQQMLTAPNTATNSHSLIKHSAYDKISLETSDNKNDNYERGEAMLAYFPKLSLCDFSVRELGVNHHYTVECVLIINVFIEKIYTFLWFWFTILLITSMLEFFVFMYKLSFLGKQHYLGTLLDNQYFVDRTHSSRDEIRRFTQWCGSELCFILRLLEVNSGTLLVERLAERLFDNYVNYANIQVK